MLTRYIHKYYMADIITITHAGIAVEMMITIYLYLLTQTWLTVTLQS